MSKNEKNSANDSRKTGEIIEREISAREEKLTRKIHRLDFVRNDVEEKIREKAEKKFAKLTKKRKFAKLDAEQKIGQKNKSKLAKKHPKIYAFFAPIWWISRKISRNNMKLHEKYPHYSFRLTPRGKTKRGIVGMGGYLRFNGDVWRFIMDNKWLFAKFLLLYSVLSAIIIGLLSQESFTALRDSLKSTGAGPVSSFVALVSGAITGVGGNGSALGASAPVATVFLFVYGWLTLIFLIRARKNGEKVKLRDGLYGGGSDVLAMAVVIIWIFVQLIPIALAMMIYQSLSSVGIINNGVAIENMAAWFLMAVVAIMTLYWLCSSFIALVIVTLPGVYPRAAMSVASELATSRRMNIMFRLISMAIPLAILWFIVMLIFVNVDGWLVSMKITWIPLVPFVILIMTTMTIIWCAVYIFMLCDKIINDPTPPVLTEKQLAKNKKIAKKDAEKAAKKLAKYAKRGTKISDKVREKLTDKIKKK